MASSTMAISTRFNLIDGMTKGFKKMSKSATGFGSVLGGILSANIIQTGFAKLKQGMSSFVTEASKVEDAVAGFQPLMGGVERATQLVDRLNKEAATTSFQFEGIASVAKQLLPVMNGSIEKTADTFRMLGDTAGGNIQKLESITRGYTKAMLKGKPDMEALNMIAEAGVPIFTEMSKTMGVSVAQLTQMSSKGKLTNDQLTKTFQNMTKEGGIFFNGMEIASQTFTGKMSTLRDNISLTAAGIGNALLPVLKDGVDWLINAASGVREWVTANKELIKTKIDQFVNTLKIAFKTIAPPMKIIIDGIMTIGKAILRVAQAALSPFVGDINNANKALEALAPILNFVSDLFDTFAAGIEFVAMGVSELLKFLKPVIPVIVAVTAAWAAMNIIAFMNPFTAVVVVIGLLITALGFLKKNWDSVTKAVGDFGGMIAGGFSAALKGVADFFGFLGEKIAGVVGLFTALGTVIVDKVVGAFEYMWSIVEPIVKGISDFVGGVGDFFGGAVGGVADFFGGVGEGIGDFFGGGKKQEAPNRREVEARQSIQFDGNLNINGAPPGSTFSSKTTGAPPIRYQMLGAQ